MKDTFTEDDFEPAEEVFTEDDFAPTDPFSYGEEFGPPIAPPAETSWEGGYSPEATSNIVQEIRGSSDSGIRKAALNNDNRGVSSASVQPSDKPKLPYADQLDAGGTEAIALARGTRSGLSLGYDDEIGGAGQALFELAKGNNWDYAKFRDEFRKANAESEAEHPYLYGGAKLAGNIVTGTLTGGTSVPALAGLGALQAAGESEADTIEGVIDDAETGGLLGAAGGTFGKVLGKALPAAGRQLSKVSEWAGEKALGISGKQAANLPKGAVREVLDRKGISWFGTPEKNLKTVEGIKKEAGGHLFDVIDQLDNAGGKIDVADLTEALQKRIDKLAEVPGTVNKTIIRQLNREMDELLKTTTVSLPISKVEEMKRLWANPKLYTDVEPGSAVKRSGAKDIAAIYRNASNEAAEATDPALAKQFMQQKSTVGNMDDIEVAAHKSSKQPKDIVDQVLNRATNAGTGAVAGGLYGGYEAGTRSNWDPTKTLGGAAGGAFTGALVSRGSSFAARTADLLGGWLQRSPQLFGRYSKSLMAAMQRGGTSLAATHFALSHTDPEYKRISEKIMNSNPEDLDADNMER